MSDNAPSIPTPSVIPYLFYADLPEITSFLTEAFGLVRHAVHTDSSGSWVNVELRLGEQFLMLSPSHPEMGLTSPKNLPANHALVLVYLDDVDTHHAQATRAGAEIWYEPQDMPYGQREYGALDPEGGRWTFAALRPAGT